MKPAARHSEIETLLPAAQEALQRADLAEARSRFQSILALEARHAVANYWLGVLALKAGSAHEAIPRLEIAAAQHPEFADFRVDLGLAYQAAGQTEQAETCFRGVRQTWPEYGNEQLRLAEDFVRQRKLPEAVEACRRGLLVFPNAPALLLKLADLCWRLNRWPDALQVWQRLLQSQPKHAPTHLAFGEACYQAGDLERACEAFQRALELEPDSLGGLLNLGLTCQKLGDHPRAFAAFQRALAIKPNHAEIHKTLGDLYRDLGRWPEANAAWRNAVELRPDYADAWHNLGLGLERLNRLEEALACHERVVQLRPRQAAAHRYRGMICQDLGQVDAARAAYLEALRLAPKDPEAHWQMFALQAAQGEFPQAWEEHEWRWQIKGRTTPQREFTKPAWDGGDLHGRTILVYSEQGFGDTIQAVRYVPRLVDRGARVLVWCPPELVSLLRTVPGAEEVFDKLSAAHLFDVQMPLLSLPLRFGTTLATIPRDVPYLRAPKDQPVVLPAASNTRPKLGLVWCGSLSQPNDRRPIPFELLSPLLEMADLDFYSLQTGPSATDLKRAHPSQRIVDLSPKLTDFAATAAAIQQLDLVITVDTAVAHLAGALGKPVWVLLSFAPDWRWLRDREDSPWYPTMRLFRQTKPGDWGDVIDRIHRALLDWLGTQPQVSVYRSADFQSAVSQDCILQGVQTDRDLGPGRRSADFKSAIQQSATLRYDPRHDERIQPSLSGVKNWLGRALAHHQAGQWADAEKLYRRVLESEPNHGDAMRFLGVLERQRGHLDSARAWLEKAVAVQPGSAQTQHDLGLVWFDLGRFDEAIGAYRRALTMQPQFADAHYNLGNACYAAKKPKEAEACYRRALEQQPDLVDAHFNLGLLAQEGGCHPDAIAHYQQTLKHQPQHLGALLNLGLALKDAGQWREAEVCLRQILELDPAHAEARVNLAAMLAEPARNLANREELQRAEALCVETLEKQPALPQAWVNLGVIRQALGGAVQALECFQRALQLQPENADARYNLAIAQLLCGNFESGWRNYEARWQTANPVFASRGFKQPRWEGQELADRMLLVHAEQGLGDAIQFVRYLPAVAQLGGRVLFECPPSLKKLLSTVESEIKVLSRGERGPACDFQIPLLSLPLLMGTTLPTIPNRVPYLSVPERVQFNLPVSSPDRLRVGIVWAGNPQHGSDRSRSLALALLAPLLARTNVSFYSLQVGPASQQLRKLATAGNIFDLGPQLTDFALTAAAIQQLDLVISVDTAVAHLAGALAKPVWVLLPFAPDWRWLLEREDSPWYPTMRLFRQPSHGGWASVMARVRAALEKELQC